MSGIVGSKLNIRGSGRIAKLGTDGQVLTSSGPGKPANYEAGATTYDDFGVRSDIMTVALRQGVQENMNKHNLPNSAVCTFEADSDYDSGGSTDITRDSSEYISSIEPPGPFGGNDAYTELLIHGDGADASTTITDSSSNDFTTTVYGSLQLDTAQKKFGTASVLYAGNTSTSGTSYMTWADNAVFNPGSADLTLDHWVRFTDQVPESTFSIMHGEGSWTGNPNHNYYVNWGATTVSARARIGTTGYTATFDNGSSWSLDTWYHMAYERFSDVLTIYIDGVAGGTTASLSGAINDTSYAMRSGEGRAGGGGSFYMDGWIDELRVSVGVARFQGAFTPPTVAYGDGSANATGTALGTTNVPTSAVTEVSGVMLMKNAYGTNTLGTDVKVYFTADNSNWTEAATYTDAGTFSDTTKQITLGKTTVTSGSDVRWKIAFANQVADTKVANVYGIGTNY